MCINFKKKSCNFAAIFKFINLIEIMDKYIKFFKVFVEELKNKLPKYIIFNKNFKYIPLIPVEKRFKKVFNYINENYQIKEEILDWVIYVNDN